MATGLEAAVIGVDGFAALMDDGRRIGEIGLDVGQGRGTVGDAETRGKLRIVVDLTMALKRSSVRFRLAPPTNLLISHDFQSL